VRNGKALGAVVAGILALAVLAAGVAASVVYDRLELVEASPALPVCAVLAVVALGLGGQARIAHQRSLGRIGGAAVARFGRVLGGLALLLDLTAALAVGVYALLIAFG
jgi:xanthosine utilization system XapX-like protein